MEKSTWKTLAIIFIILFLLENSLFFIAVDSINQEERQENICYYEICEDYVNAYYYSESKVCSCYESDLLGNEVLSKSKYMGKR